MEKIWTDVRNILLFQDWNDSCLPLFTWCFDELQILYSLDKDCGWPASSSGYEAGFLFQSGLNFDLFWILTTTICRKIFLSSYWIFKSSYGFRLQWKTKLVWWRRKTQIKTERQIVSICTSVQHDQGTHSRVIKRSQIDSHIENKLPIVITDLHYHQWWELPLPFVSEKSFQKKKT